MFKRVDSKARLPKNIDSSKYYRMTADFQYLKKRNYRVLREIGRGGYGVVYKAEDLEDRDSYCAIKIHFGTVLREQVALEVHMLMLVKDRPHIASLRHIIEDRGSFHLIIDYHAAAAYIVHLAD